MTNIKKLKIIGIISSCVLFMAILAFGLRILTAQAKDPDQAQIEANVKEMKALEAINLKNGCKANSDRFSRLQKANQALQGDTSF